MAVFGGLSVISYSLQPFHGRYGNRYDGAMQPSPTEEVVEQLHHTNDSTQGSQ